MSYHSWAKTLTSKDGRFVLAAAALSLLAFRAIGSPPPTSTPKVEIETITVEAARERERVAKAWNRRDVYLFDNGDDHGGTEIRKFLDAKLPIRAWYNVEIYNDDGTPLNYLDTTPGLGLQGARKNVHPMPSRISFEDVRDLSSVIVLIDASRATGVSYGQLAAYVAMVGLAEIKIDATASSAPSILQLFSDIAKPAPTGLTEWDEAFLKGLYQSNHVDQQQILAI
jgi:hypothetical protein